MTILNIKGGLGNQVFQLIAAYTFLKRERISHLKVYYGNLSYYSTSRDFELLPFINNDYFEVKIISRNWIVFLNKFVLSILYKFNFLSCNERNFRSNYLNINIVDGYFQDVSFVSKFSIDLVKESLKDFRFNFYNKVREEFYIDLKNNDILGIHFRFGDRFNIDIYNEYLNRIDSFDFTKYNHVIVFSDQIDLCNQIIGLIPVKVTIVEQYNLSDFEEFVFCSLIYEFLVCNSTFSISARLFSAADATTYLYKSDFVDYGNNLPSLLRENCHVIEF